MWNLYENNNELKPLCFSNGKNQEDVVREVMKEIENGKKIIFIKGICGTGKSAIALNIAKEFKRTSIVVPIKSLQEQYIKDYTDRKYVLNKKGEKLKISSIIGRSNFKCKYIEENKEKFDDKNKKERNLRLFEVFNKRPSINYSNDDSCDNIFLPCKMEIKDKNSEKIKDYIRLNPSVKIENFESIKDVKRMTIAPVCPYWSPIYQEDFEIKKFKDVKKIKYVGIDDRNYIIHQRKEGCPYYGQYLAYDNSEVIIFNSLKYKFETLMNRRPKTDIEIIDECDEFLDSFANQRKINLSKLIYSLNTILPEKENLKQIINELIDITNTLIRRYNEQPIGDIQKLKNTLIEELLTTINKDEGLLEELDEYNYLTYLYETSQDFINIIEESFYSVEKRDRDIIINIISLNLAGKFKELEEKSKVIILMSGTIHSESVLRMIFGIQNFSIIEAETKNQGELIKCKNGYEIDCKHSNFKTQKISREQYLTAFSKCVELAKKPTLVHLTSFSDLPTELEKLNFKIDNLPSQNEIIKGQEEDKLGRNIIDFKNKKIDILFTTKCTRGIDFPGDTCNSIIISRFPYPDISSIFWKTLKNVHPQSFMPFYMDKAKREILQRVYRGLRSKEDKVYLLSPDIRVLDFNFN